MRANWPPPIWLAGERPAHKWLGRFGALWISAAGAVFFLFLLLVGGLLLHNGASVTVGLLVGSVTVAGAFIYTMAYRVGPRDTLSVARVLIAFGLGGLVAVTVGSSFDSLLATAFPGAGSTPSLVVLSLAGISEELAKILAVVVVSRKLADKSMRNGLFLGGAVGLGFAALEDLAYAVNFYQNPPAQLHLTHLGAALVLVPTRALLTPFLHPLYTALLGAALFAASKNGRFRITRLVVVAYLGVSLAHGLWDGSAGILQHVTGILQIALAPVVVFVVYPGVIVGTGLIWIKVARRARFRFHTRVLWWLAPPPSGGPAAPGGPGAALPVGGALALPPVGPPLALPPAQLAPLAPEAASPQLEHAQPGQPQPVQPHPGQLQPGQLHPGQPEPAQPQPGQPHPGQLQPGQPQPAQPPAGSPQPGQPPQLPPAEAWPPPAAWPPPRPDTRA